MFIKGNWIIHKKLIDKLFNENHMMDMKIIHHWINKIMNMQQQMNNLNTWEKTNQTEM